MLSVDPSFTSTLKSLSVKHSDQAYEYFDILNMEEAILWPLLLENFEASTVTGPSCYQLKKIFLTSPNGCMFGHVFQGKRL